MDVRVDAGSKGPVRATRVVQRASPLARALEWGRPYLARARGEGYFADGVDTATCDAIHESARRQTLYRFAPPPPLRAIVERTDAGSTESYAFRSPFVSHLRARNDGHFAWSAHVGNPVNAPIRGLASVEAPCPR